MKVDAEDVDADLRFPNQLNPVLDQNAPKEYKGEIIMPDRASCTYKIRMWMPWQLPEEMWSKTLSFYTWDIPTETIKELTQDVVDGKISKFSFETA